MALPSTDSFLVARARRGDGRAFAALFRRYHPLVLRFFERRLDGRDAAGEAAQETFVRAFLRLHTLRCPERVRSWLFAFARHVLLETRRARTWQTPPEDLAAAATETPEALMLRQELARSIERAVAALPRARQSALLLRVVDEYDYQQIGTRLAWPRGKVKNEIHRARLELSRRLRSQGAS
jgi:RNA polymerase sigma-70 factor (ECF subfamily)